MQENDVKRRFASHSRNTYVRLRGMKTQRIPSFLKHSLALASACAMVGALSVTMPAASHADERRTNDSQSAESIESLSAYDTVDSLTALNGVEDLQGFDLSRARDFLPGHIIDDELMYGEGAAQSLTDGEIQNFLTQQGKRCQQGQDGSPCLKNATFTTASAPASQWCPSPYEGGGTESAAQIIGKVARSCNVSPKALLVLLQKEQGLVTTTNPTQRAYSHATGFACPDGAPCSQQFAGFPRQVLSAASRLQQYRLQPQSFNFRAGMTANILYHPSRSCGTRTVTIDNAATAALYNYTPYTPNDALLRGEADQCSSYGNYNFFLIYERWFGATRGADAQPSPQPSPIPTSPGGFRVSGAIGWLWGRLGGASGVMGVPASNEESTANGGIYQLYTHGTAYWHPTTGAHFVEHSPIFSQYQTQGFERGSLGYPLDEEHKVPGGAAQTFQNGVIYWNTTTATTHVIYPNSGLGYLHTHLGAATGSMGIPASNEESTANGGIYQLYTHGTAYWHPTTGAHFVEHSPIFSQYQNQSFERGPLGYPTSEAYPNPDGTISQHFQGGTLTTH